MLRTLLASLLVLASAVAQAGMGMAQLPPPAPGDGPVTVFYPTAAADTATRRGPFTIAMVPDAAPSAGNARLVVISHGSGGNAWVQTDLARALVETGYVVAMPEHRGDNSRDPSRPGPESWKLRPAEVSRAIDAVARDPRFAPIDFARVGMYGMSAGGHTALTLAGGRWSPAAFRDHCEAHIAEDFPTCVGLLTKLRGDAFDGMKKTVALAVIRHRFDDAQWHTHTDPRIRAVVAGVPAAADFDASSLASPRVPLALVTARDDKWLAPRFHSDRIVAACRGCEVLADLKVGGHGALLSPPPPADVLGETARDLLGDPPGFDRAILREIDRRIVRFFDHHLGA